MKLSRHVAKTRFYGKRSSAENETAPKTSEGESYED